MKTLKVLTSLIGTLEDFMNYEELQWAMSLSPLMRLEEEDEEEDKTEDIKIPMVRTGISTKRNVQVPSQSESYPNGNDTEVEKIKGTGMITALDWQMNSAVIERQYQFEPENFCPEGTNYQRGSKVEYEAERT